MTLIKRIDTDQNYLGQNRSACISLIRSIRVPFLKLSQHYHDLEIEF